MFATAVHPRPARPFRASLSSLRPLAVLGPLAVLAGCATSGAPGPAPSHPSRPHAERTHGLPPAPHRTAPPPPRLMTAPGLEGVIGAHEDALIRQFGEPRLNVEEGDARKLQFVGPACVLDVYLYPLAPGQAPEATYAEARRATDARDVDRAACVAALRKGK